MRRTAARQVLNIASLGMTLTVNTLANTVKINGRRTGEISDSFANFFVPAGYVFAIWGVIYVALITFAVYQALPAQKRSERIARIDGWFVASNVCNTAWLFAWHYGQYTLSLLLMLSLLISLVMIYARLDADRAVVRGSQRWLVNVPFSVYLGWITVAVVPNTSVALIAAGWNGFGVSGEVWAVVLLAIATTIGALVALPRRDWVYAAVLVWAFAGIGAKFATLPLLANAAYCATAVIAVVALVSLVRNVSSGAPPRRTAQA